MKFYFAIQVEGEPRPQEGTIEAENKEEAKRLIQDAIGNISEIVYLKSKEERKNPLSGIHCSGSSVYRTLGSAPGGLR